ncbi:hypothetical protein VTK26DRAFT_6501 [Humicola hyalothermophila]
MCTEYTTVKTDAPSALTQLLRTVAPDPPLSGPARDVRLLLAKQATAEANASNARQTAVSKQLGWKLGIGIVKFLPGVLTIFAFVTHRRVWRANATSWCCQPPADPTPTAAPPRLQLLSFSSSTDGRQSYCGISTNRSTATNSRSSNRHRQSGSNCTHWDPSIVSELLGSQCYSFLSLPTGPRAARTTAGQAAGGGLEPGGLHLERGLPAGFVQQPWRLA